MPICSLPDSPTGPQQLAKSLLEEAFLAAQGGDYATADRKVAEVFPIEVFEGLLGRPDLRKSDEEIVKLVRVGGWNVARFATQVVTGDIADMAFGPEGTTRVKGACKDSVAAAVAELHKKIEADEKTEVFIGDPHVFVKVDAFMVHMVLHALLAVRSLEAPDQLKDTTPLDEEMEAPWATNQM